MSWGCVMSLSPLSAFPHRLFLPSPSFSQSSHHIFRSRFFPSNLLPCPLFSCSVLDQSKPALTGKYRLKAYIPTLQRQHSGISERNSMLLAFLTYWGKKFIIIYAICPFLTFWHRLIIISQRRRQASYSLFLVLLYQVCLSTALMHFLHLLRDQLPFQLLMFQNILKLNTVM